jgi:hypothetical protein
MVKCALLRFVLSFDVFDKLSPSGKPIAVSGACLDRAMVLAIMFM